MASPDRELLDRARGGDSRAFGGLVERYQKRVYAVARRMVGNHAEADDVTQEAFLRAFRGLASFNGDSSFFTWLYRIAINVSLNHRRSGGGPGGAQTTELDGRSEGHSPWDPVERMEAREEARQVNDALMTLPAAIRAAVVLHILEGLPQAEVARVLECAEGTVAWRINQGRKLLREVLK